MKNMFSAQTGVDLVLDSRIESNLKNENFLNKIFHPSELAIINTKKIAGIFACKEAAMKALNVSSVDWLNIEVKYKKNGRPEIVLAKEIIPKGFLSIDVSISHENNMTIAFAVMLLEKK